MGKGHEICVNVTLLDGLVLARSVFHHSLNYRSALLFGVPEEISDLEKKREALLIITNHLAPNRWEEARRPTDAEIRATSVFSLPISEGSAKIRTGPPSDLEEDMNFPVWAGIVPIDNRLGDPVPDPDILPGLPLPALLKASRFSPKGGR
ncbi:MAG: Flavin-nucleotide-binding protein-like protein [Leptospirillum sp. Group IV 'UBA BS']|nr:MAG: Flavin-nucleotide-binding protein-like protein [Leptospirillum sp. Group IV 'UBA BS']